MYSLTCRSKSIEYSWSSSFIDFDSPEKGEVQEIEEKKKKIGKRIDVFNFRPLVIIRERGSRESRG